MMISSASDDILLTARDLAVGYERDVQQGLEVIIRRGDIVRLRGANGSGKTTLLRTLLGHLPPRAGTIRYTEEASVGRELAYVPQNAHDALLPWFDCYDNILLGVMHGAPLNGHSSFRRLIDAFALVKQETEQPLRDLLRQSWSGIDISTRSGGQRQRISLVRAFIGSPTIAFLDEPFQELDGEASDAFSAFVQTYVAETEGAAIFVSHHDVSLRATREVELP